MRTTALVLALLFAAGARAEDAVWPHYGGAKRDFVLPAAAARAEDGVWARDLGPGSCGLVSDGAALYTLYCVPDVKKNSEGEEVVVALDRMTGRTLWEHKAPVARLAGQQSFTGEAIRPLATPALRDGKLLTLGYAGALKCFDAATGRVVWSHDLVKDFEATPVQFGFSASPLVTGDLFVVHVGGKQAAAIAFDPADGKPAWKSAPAQPSYASPVVMPTATGDVIVQVTRDAVLGLSAKDGAARWSYRMPKTGLTNVPTPIVLPGQRLLLSGQGLLGTRLLQIATAPGGDTVAEVWTNPKVAYFYTSWFTDGEAIYGTSDKLLRALSLADGKELWREPGQTEANPIRVGGEALVLRGDGKLTRGTLSAAGLEVTATAEPLKGRCWAAPTVIGDIVYVRSEARLAAVRLSSLGKP